MKRWLIVLLLTIPAFAQKDFLSDTEIDQIRAVQEPVARIKLYLLFAKQRLDQMNSLLAKDRPGRSGEIRQLLEDYTSIIDAIGTVSDDALLRKNDVTAAPAALTDGEKKFLDQLNRVQASSPRDLQMYGFELKEAIAATSDSLDAAHGDLDARGRELSVQAEQEKKQVADINAAERKLGPPDPETDKALQAGEDATKPARPAPTLYRPGEKPDSNSK
jgi:hypothetical protein